MQLPTTLVLLGLLAAASSMAAPSYGENRQESSYPEEHDSYPENHASYPNDYSDNSYLVRRTPIFPGMAAAMRNVANNPALLNMQLPTTLILLGLLAAASSMAAPSYGENRQEASYPEQHASYPEQHASYPEHHTSYPNDHSGNSYLVRRRLNVKLLRKLSAMAARRAAAKAAAAKPPSPAAAAT
ncbi:hypothetical protein BJ684DRAFT_19614 [Piptocephalis cylindrospora]|uniref:Uncharacterized protein n=1 Tax=Piptocephalis cylindrospora TaxID=1907219 RepID=A0A4P9Y5F2_9FUNG|nr:hypothetical protein BJ684DRAFT_19614 [Piptocephalis cylindrospora]|eukprot:RKP13942.1 hypothetical protein BJ684DRAFT_19614 [Piptocephalis cylindrospora]